MTSVDSGSQHVGVCTSPMQLPRIKDYRSIVGYRNTTTGKVYINTQTQTITASEKKLMVATI